MLRDIFKNILLSVAAIVFALVVIEVFIRITTERLYQPSSDMVVVREMRPGVKNGVEVKINRHGFRDKEYDTKNKDNVFRIIGL